MSHPLDRPAWNSLSTRNAALSAGGALARRFVAEVNILAAAADPGAAAQAALGALGATPLALVEADRWPVPPAMVLERQVPILQMLLDRDAVPGTAAEAVDLGDADAPEMLALATLTQPGPFFAGTHRVGGFVGVRREGRLVAMAGERMNMPGFTEVSGVCTHPDWRGQGLAPALMRIVIARARARGEAVFLHAFPDNPAVGLYEAMGFRARRQMWLTIAVPEGADVANPLS